MQSCAEEDIMVPEVGGDAPQGPNTRSQEAHRAVFGLDAVQAIARREHLMLLIVNAREQEVVEWIE
jgi:hypothetical protein